MLFKEITSFNYFPEDYVLEMEIESGDGLESVLSGTPWTEVPTANSLSGKTRPPNYFPQSLTSSNSDHCVRRELGRLPYSQANLSVAVAWITTEINSRAVAATSIPHITRFHLLGHAVMSQPMKLQLDVFATTLKCSVPGALYAELRGRDPTAPVAVTVAPPTPADEAAALADAAAAYMIQHPAVPLAVSQLVVISANQIKQRWRQSLRRRSSGRA